MTHRTLDYTKDYLKELSGLLPKHFKQVVSKVLALASDPFPSDAKQLQGYDDLFRVDLGEYRIIYT
ncbi:MAG: type II toxin-antitoxin system RelE family toxin, partial [Methylocella sp.]